MRLESFIAGALIGLFVGNPRNQEMIKNILEKSINAINDIANKRSDTDVSKAITVSPAETNE